jgi:uncharacterized OB-fold protein
MAPTPAVVPPPQPAVDPDSAPFWAAVDAGELRLARCPECRRWQHPPLERCRRCAALLEFEAVAGTGVVYSFIVVRYPAVPAYADSLPYVIALVELDEQPGLRLSGRLDAPVDQVDVGARVRAEIVDVPGAEHRLPIFRVVGGAA